MNGLTARERRLVAIAILFAVVAAAWIVVVSPLLAGFTARETERQGLLADYQRDQRLIAAIPGLRAQAEAQKRTAAAFALAAPSQLQAQEALRQRITSAITAAGAGAPTVQDVQADLPSGWIGARAEARLSRSQLNESLRVLENEEPYVAVDYISIDAEQAFRTSHAGLLDVRLELSVPFRLADARQP
jgi:general secretion pathway protein M